MENKQHATLQPMGHHRKQKENFKNPWDKWKWKHNCQIYMGWSKSSSKGKIHSEIDLPAETRKFSNKQPNFTPKATRERRTNKTQT